MKTKEPNEIMVLDSVDEGRRGFVKKLVAGTAFATPLLASFSMDGALIGEAKANYFAPYCADYDVSYSYTARYEAQDKSARFHATLVPDVLDGKTISVILNFSPRNDFLSGKIYIAGRDVGTLQLGPNVLPIGDYSGNPCDFLTDLADGWGEIEVTDQNGGVHKASLIRNG